MNVITRSSRRVAIGGMIRKLRLEKEWTQKTLAEKMCWKGAHAVKTISKIEQGIQNLSREKLADFAKVFSIKVQDLSPVSLPNEINLEAAITFQGDLRPILHKISQLPDAVTVQSLFCMLDQYCSLKNSGLKI